MKKHFRIAALSLGFALAAGAGARGQSVVDLTFDYGGDVVITACEADILVLREVCIVAVRGEAGVGYLGYGLEDDGAGGLLHIVSLTATNDITAAPPRITVDGENVATWEGPVHVYGRRWMILNDAGGQDLSAIVEGLRSGTAADVTVTLQSGETETLHFAVAELGAAMDALDAAHAAATAR